MGFLSVIGGRHSVTCHNKFADSHFQHPSHAFIQYKSRIYSFANQSHKLGESVAMEHILHTSFQLLGATQCHAFGSNFSS